MQTIIGVRFKKAGKIYYFGPGNLEIKQGDRVVVETARGMECGEAVIGPRELPDEQITQPLKIVHRIANASDLKRIEDNKKREQEAMTICEEKIAAHKLPMNLVEVECTFDMNKIIFYFTADGRIDFRDLVKDLAAVFRTRIELRQIGVRDEAKLMGGIGCCGRPLCCATFLGDFEPVSIRMAKDQNLSLNPTKISGICGRLMCCLKYENDCYCGENCPKKAKKIQPPTPGNRVVSMDGEGKVISINQQRRTATILLDNSRTIVASWEDVIEKDNDEQAAPSAIVTDVNENEERPRRERSERPRRERRPRENRENKEGREERQRRERDGEGGRRRRPNRDKGENKENREGGQRGEHRSRPRRERRPRENRENRENKGENRGGNGSRESRAPQASAESRPQQAPAEPRPQE